MNDQKYLLSFKGRKQELHAQLKVWCEEAGQSMNGTILELIANHLKKTNFIKSKQAGTLIEDGYQDFLSPESRKIVNKALKQ